ncbi:MAG TPA: TonB-dependent receptor [Gemmatimonadales bacterium]
MAFHRSSLRHLTHLTRSARGALLAAAMLAASGAGASAAAQQSGTVRGTVSDSSTGRPLSGVQVVVVGSSLGAVTDDAGVYVVSGVPAGQARLSARRLGYGAGDRTVAVAAGRTATADFSLAPLPTMLSAIVSVGYGSSARAQVSSAIASVDSTAFANVPVASIDNALQGKIPGVQVVQNSGEPGSGVSVRVRGPASLNAGNQPLYVVDGVPILQGSYSQAGQSGQDQTAISALNPDEIASIDVLKDAAATAIYGSRGSNGVILITTKRGAAGATRFSFSGYVGSQRAERRLGLLDAQQYVELFNEGARNDGYDPEDYDFEPGVDDAASYDWQDAIFRQATVSDLTLSASGGSDRLRFFVSGSNYDQRGIVVASGYQRQSGRLNLDFSATDRLRLSSSIALTREDQDRVPGDQSNYGVVTNALGMQPMRPVYGTNNGFGGRAEGLRYSNPVAIAAFNENNYRTFRALGRIEGTYDILDGLSFTGRAAADVLNVDELQWASPRVDRTSAQNLGGYAQDASANVSRYLLEGFAVAAPEIGPGSLTITAGSSLELNRSEFDYMLGEGFPTGFTRYVRNAAAITDWDGTRTESNLVSFFARANWSLDDRYLAGVSLRADGSSRFGEDNRYGIFPAATLGWVVTEEPMFAGLARHATLKLRGSYGVTGNQGIGDYASLSLVTGTAYAGSPGITGSQLGNPDLRWETTREVDLGADIGLLDGRVSVIVDWYNRNTDDLLVSRPVPTTSGYSSTWDNIGSIRNRGVDLALETVNLQSEDGLGWTSNLNVTWNRNEVTSLYEDQPITFTVSSRVTSIAAVGQPLGEFYLYKFLRVNPENGNAVFATADGGETERPTASDLTFVGSPQPDYYGGFTNTFTWKNLDLRAFLQFSQGNKVFNMMRIFMDDGAYSYDNKSTITLDRWQKPGDVTDTPRMSYDGTSGSRLMSSRMVEDGSFVRLGEITLGVRVPQRLTGFTGLDEARLYVSGRNLKTWTDYTGYNPDVSSSGAAANVVTGVDYYAYPLARTVTIGLSAAW